MISDHTETFADLLRRYRNAAGLTQEELAERANMSAHAISALERGVRQHPYRGTVQLLASALGLTAEQRSQLELAARTATASATAHRGVASAPLSSAVSLRGSRRDNLPFQMTSFVGRTVELEQARDLICRAGVRLVTLTGPGGSGKTRLALEVAAGLLNDFTTGVYFVNLAPISDPDLVLPAIAGALDVREAAGQALLTRLSDAIGDQRMLLVLDNFEHLAVAAPRVAELLAATPRLAVLATSRERLHLRGEKELQVPPLLVPDLRALPLLAELAQSEAMRLFVERAQDVAPSFALTDANAPIVAAICQRLDGLPLAIELAAPRTRVLPPLVLLAQLSSRLGVLTGGAADLPDRQRTLHNTIAWSYNLLTTPGQILFRRLGVFVDGCTLDAAESVCGGPEARDVRGLALLNGVTSLVDKHLLRQEEQDDGRPRFTMLATIREFALARLEETGEAADLRQRHATYFLGLAERDHARVSSAERLLAMREFAQEEENMRAALSWLLRQDGDAAIEHAARLATALKPFWNYRGHHVEGSSWLEAALARYPGPAAGRSEIVRAKAINALANLAYFEHDENRARARALLQDNLPYWRELGDKRVLAEALVELCGLTTDLDSSLSLLEESLVLAREAGDKVLLAEALFWICLPVHMQVERAQVRAYAEESFKLFSELGDRWGAAMPNSMLGNIAWLEGNQAAARSHYEESLVLMQEAGDTPGVAWTSKLLGLLAYRQSDYERARYHAERSLTLGRQMGDPFAVALPLTVLGMVAREQGDYARARSLLRESLSIKLDPRPLAALAGVELAQAREVDAAQRAARLLGLARSLRDATSQPWFPPPEPDEDQKFIETCRSLLDEETWAAAWAEGQAMSLEAVLSELSEAWS